VFISRPSTRAEFLWFGRGLSATACPNPEPQSGEVEFCRRPAKPEKFGEPEGPQGAGLEINTLLLARLKNPN